MSKPVKISAKSNALMSTAANRIWVLRARPVPFDSNAETNVYFSRDLHELMSQHLSEYHTYTISFVPLTLVHVHWLELMDKMEYLEPKMAWRAWPCTKSRLNIMHENLSEWYDILLSSNVLSPLVSTTLSNIFDAQQLIKLIREGLEND